MNAPPLSQQADWYLLAQLEKFKTGMRGANPKDFTGAQMRAMSSTLQDTTAMRDVVAYIKTLSH
jgi:cytochrome c oxidase subunit 2